MVEERKDEAANQPQEAMLTPNQHFGKLIQSQTEFTKKIIEQREVASQFMIAEMGDKHERAERFQREVEQDANQIEDLILALRKKIEENLATAENLDGFLTLGSFDYLECLQSIRKQRLLQRIKSDIDFWRAHTEQVAQQRDHLMHRFEEMLKRHQRELQGFLQTSPVVSGLKKMPLFFADALGDDCESDFCFPNSDMWRNIQQHRPRVEKLQAWFSNSHNHCLTWLDIHLTGNHLGRMAAQPGASNSHPLELKPVKKITKVGVVVFPQQGNRIAAIYFYDEDGKETIWGPGGNPYRKNAAGTNYEEQEMGKGEELIGFHGIAGRQQYITALGLLTRRVIPE